MSVGCTRARKFQSGHVLVCWYPLDDQSFPQRDALWRPARKLGNEVENMNILVTGGAGFIGSNVVDEYIASGHTVIVIDDLSTGRLSNVNANAIIVKMDIRAPEIADIFEKYNIDLVNHH